MRIIKLFLTSLVIAIPLFSQPQSDFNFEAYKSFFQSSQNLTPEQLRTMHPSGLFEARVSSVQKPFYMDSVDSKYSLTGYEKELLAKHGFVVTSRLSYPSFIDAFEDVFHSDLPVFVSTDAILHAIHRSYDNILKEVENSRMIYWLDTLLEKIHNQLPVLQERYASNPQMLTMLKDFDVYLTMPRQLLGKQVNPYFSENSALLNTLHQYIADLGTQEIQLFSYATKRIVDFSQFKVRGHYTESEVLSRYFQAMMWLGRIEIYLIAPKSPGVQQEGIELDVQRQAILALLVAEAIESADAKRLLDTLDHTIKFFVGESDNVTFDNIVELKQMLNIQRADTLLDIEFFRHFQDLLAQQSFAEQRILSQIIMSDPLSPDQIKPSSAFLLLGQRFVIDSYVTANVVYDKIIYNDGKVRRMLPSTLDVLFGLGNNAAAQLLESELQKYHYSSNLAALRYLIDSYSSDFWISSLYNAWLQMVRKLNPPNERTQLPAFMQTAAWWQEKMNTQLAAWAELRHDNLLYAKQSYTGGITCSYPYSYVEPFPEFYSTLKSYATLAAECFGKMQLTYIQQYFSDVCGIADTLQSIAQKTLERKSVSEEEKTFLQNMLIITSPYNVCGSSKTYNGWYPKLYFTSQSELTEFNAIVADVHTAPTNEFGEMVGWVLHAGTGNVEMVIVNAELSDGQWITFIGPVYKYHELVTTNFQRLTDEEWKEMYSQSQPPRPPFVNLYLANGVGETMGEAISLATSISDLPINQQPTTFELAQNFPNPFNSGTIISFKIPTSLAHSIVKVKIYTIVGQEVATLLEQELPAGNYAVRWDGTTDKNISAASGVYFYRVSVGSQQKIGKMLLVR